MIRESEGLKQETLARGICSSKYVYMIEKGERSPSIDVLMKLGTRLKVDFLDYLPYMDCLDPLGVKYTIETLEELNHTTDLDDLMKLIKQAEKMADFKKQPWKNKLLYNELYCRIFQDSGNSKHLSGIEKLIISCGGDLVPTEVNRAEISDELADYYNLLGFYHMLNKDMVAARVYVDVAYDFYRGAKEIRRHQKGFVSVALNYINTLIVQEEYLKAIKVGRELIAFQLEKANLERIHVSYYFLSKALFLSGEEDEAIRWYKKFLCMGIALTDQSHLDNYLTSDFGRCINKMVAFKNEFWREVL